MQPASVHSEPIGGVSHAYKYWMMDHFEKSTFVPPLTKVLPALPRCAGRRGARPQRPGCRPGPRSVLVSSGGSNQYLPGSAAQLQSAQHSLPFPECEYQWIVSCSSAIVSLLALQLRFLVGCAFECNPASHCITAPPPAPPPAPPSPAPRPGMEDEPPRTELVKCVLVGDNGKNEIIKSGN